MITVLLFLIALALTPYWLPLLFVLVAGLAYLLFGAVAVILPIILAFIGYNCWSDWNPAVQQGFFVVCVLSCIISAAFFKLSSKLEGHPK